MNKVERISVSERAALIKRIKESGLSVQLASEEAGAHVQTVYSWLSKEVEKTGVSWSEDARLKKENQQLKELVGHLTLGMSRTKKSRTLLPLMNHPTKTALAKDLQVSRASLYYKSTMTIKDERLKEQILKCHRAAGLFFIQAFNCSAEKTLCEGYTEREILCRCGVY